MSANEQLTAIKDAFEANQLDTVKTLAEEFINANPENIEGFSYMGKALLIEKNFEMADYYFLKAMNLDPKNIEILVSLAQLNLELQEVDMARHYYNTILSTEPNHVVGTIGKADCDFADDYLVGAVESYTKAFENGAKELLGDNEQAITLFKAATAYIELEKASEALDLLDKYEPESFQESLSLIRRNAIRIATPDELDKLLAVTELLHENVPSNVQYASELAELFRTKQEFGRVEEIYSKLLVLAEEMDSTQLIALYYGRAVARTEQGKNAEAIEDFDSLIALDPSAFYYSSRAKAKEAAKDVKGAVMDISHAIKIEENPNTTLYMDRGTLLMKAGAIDKAIADYSRVVKMDAEDSDAYFNLGVAFNKKGEKTKAFKMLLEAEIRGHRKAGDLLASKFTKQVAAMRERSAASLWSEFEPQVARNEQSPILQRAAEKLWGPDMNKFILAMGDEATQLPADLLKMVLKKAELDLFMITPQALLFIEGDGAPLEAYYKVEIESSHAIILEIQPTKGGERERMRLMFSGDNLLINYPLQDEEVPAKYFVEVASANDEQKGRLQDKKFNAKYTASIDTAINNL